MGTVELNVAAAVYGMIECGSGRGVRPYPAPMPDGAVIEDTAEEFMATLLAMPRDRICADGPPLRTTKGNATEDPRLLDARPGRSRTADYHPPRRVLDWSTSYDLTRPHLEAAHVP